MSTPPIKVRCKSCQQMMTQVVVPFRQRMTMGCDDGCPDQPHLHVRCEQCSEEGAYCALVIRDDGPRLLS